jgi:HEPN domain-containing protein
MDMNKQIEYWITGAEEDLESAKLLINNQKYLHGLFFCHLVIEKAMKAHIVKELKEIPPKSHNLLYLLDKLDFQIDPNIEIFFGILMKYQLEGRYPGYNPKIPAAEEAMQYFETTGDILKWLKSKL